MLCGEVIAGARIGRILGFPTANINKDPKDSGLEQGVYAAIVVLKKKKYHGALIINTRHNKVEVYIIDFFGDIYGERIAIDPQEKVSDLVSCSSKKEMKEKIAADIEKVKNFFKKK
ncbi:riboflavin kinase [Patescibacteria group bacterium]|nr:riboflavin kinase [Patescibacteria group bacterium]MBU1722062.1 riboflavin kinase [Patescibacteria group bacterium]MBU1901533.1 riboflavin kinase [Patescibacteria group bacterium]